MFIWQIFFKIAPHNGAINYFVTAIGNDILSVHYQIGGGILQKLRGSALISSANWTSLCWQIPVWKMVNLQTKVMLQLMNLSSSPKFLKKAAKTFPPYFFHGAFAPSFIWCRRPCWSSATSTSLRNCWQYFWLQDTLDNTLRTELLEKYNFLKTLTPTAYEYV